jgi:Arc/MetJ-type ribon-helix-helix transcriptional regulator
MAQEPIHITLVDEDAIEFVRSKVRSGEYASEAEVVLEGIGTLRDDADEQARWEREVLIPAHDRLMADPSTAISLETLERNLEARRRARAKTR